MTQAAANIPSRKVVTHSVGPAQVVPGSNELIKDFNTSVPAAKIPLVSVPSATSDESFNGMINSFNVALRAAGGTVFIPLMKGTVPADRLDNTNKLVNQMNAAITVLP